MPHLPWAKVVQHLVGGRVRRLRDSRKPMALTQQQLAERTRGVLSRSSIANIERGRQGISLEQLFVLAEALDIEPAELVPKREEVFGARSDVLVTLRKPIDKHDRAWVERLRQAAANESGGENA
jgi:transcriptional regulator with XRE-family HTH domain